ncbi:putative sulfate exporter family transporter [Desulfurispora thermophila]|uniref:putative sulfate exporter family transporter n=1 Tax=Desulfurispora thermophila TaxID=265470 RepID=UPI00035DC392|nr:putative sulfate exporter family transporter [Desulfurispora thermophila]
MSEHGVSYVPKPVLKDEDWWAVWLGLFIFALGLGPIYGVEPLGWVSKVGTWVDLSKAIAPISKNYHISGPVSALLTYLFMLVLTTIGAYFMGARPGRFIAGFTIIYWITFICIIIGENAYISATPDKLAKFKIGWSLGLGEMGFVFAMIVGLIIGNFFTGFAKFLEEAAKPEWFIKTGIVILGAAIGIKTVSALGLATTVIVRGLCAVVEAYLIYWPVVYFVARRFFKFTPEWAAPLASGISICGVSAAIATGAAIRSRPVIPVILAAVIIVFVAVELLFLPFVAAAFLYHDPMVAGAWMGLAVKSDGGAIASGTVTESLILAKALKAMGVKWQEGWILMATTTTKMFIDIFIGLWAFILAIIWSMYKIGKNGTGGQLDSKVSSAEIWHRFPKFVIGFTLTFLILLLMGLNDKSIVKAATEGSNHANALRTLFFALCFFSIGLVTNVRKLWQEGMGRIVGVYAVCLFGFILWVGLFISWLFYHGITPPVISG